MTPGMKAAVKLAVVWVALWMGLPAMTEAVEAVGEREAIKVAQNWIACHQADGLAGEELTVAAADGIWVDGTLVGYAVNLEPQGFVVVPAIKELPPVKAYSFENQFSVAPHGLGGLVAEELHAWVDELGEIARDDPAKSAAYLDPVNRKNWQWLLADDAVSLRPKARQPSGSQEKSALVGPLMDAAWSQGWPFNQYCPLACGGPAPLGCVATAMSQILQYWGHPASGFGTHSYVWNGGEVDGQPCGGSRLLSADYSDPYDWENMLAEVDDDSPLAVVEAVSELAWEVAVAFESNFGPTGTGALVHRAVDFLPEHFGFNQSVNRFNRLDCASEEEWFEIFREQLDLGRPVLLHLQGYRELDPETTVNHAVVVDGYRSLGLDMVHINMGWQHEQDGWYALRSIQTYNTLWMLHDRLYCVRDIFPDPCSDPSTPTDFSSDRSGVISGVSCTLSWNSEEGGLYEVASATDPSFDDQTLVTTEDASLSISQVVLVDTIFYYRVRGLGPCGNHPQISPWTDTVAVEVTAAPDYEFVYLVAGVAHTTGAAGTQWRSNLAALNMSADDAQLVLTYRHEAGSTSVVGTVPANGLQEWEDVASSLFAMTGSSAGALQVASTVELIVTARTYNQGVDGTFGQFMPGCSPGDALAPGGLGVLSQIRETSDFRTNIGLVNLSNFPCEVRIRLYSAAGEAIGSALDVTVPPGGWTQQDRVFTAAGVANWGTGYATIEVLTGAAEVWAYASVIDSTTGDATTVPLAEVPASP